MEKRTCLMVVLAAFILSCIGFPGPCSLRAATAPGIGTITDMTGRKVAVPSKPRRIVSTSPGITEILFSLGLKGRIAGVTTNCNYPPEAKNLPKIGSMHPGIERIAQLSPDLIVADRSLKIDAVAKLEKMAFPVFIVDCSTLEQFKKSLAILGKATGTEKKGKKLRKTLEERIAQVEGRLGNPSPPKRIRVFVEIWDRPLMTAGSHTFFNDLIELAGGENIFADSRSDYPKVNIESLIQRAPQVIILTTSKKADVMKRTSWSRIEAVRKGQVYEINPDILSRPTLRMIDALETMARWLHPESFATGKNGVTGSTP